MEKMLTPEEVADILKVTKRTVYIWLRTGRLKGSKLGDLWRINPADVAAFVEAGTVKDPT